MPYQIEWYLHGYIIQEKIWGHVTLEEIREVNATITKMLSTASQRVHLLYNDEELLSLSEGLPSLYRELTFVQDHNFGWAVIVNHKSNKLLDYIIATFAKLTGTRYTHVRSIEDAIRELIMYDLTLRHHLNEINAVGFQ